MEGAGQQRLIIQKLQQKFGGLYQHHSYVNPK